MPSQLKGFCESKMVGAELPLVTPREQAGVNSLGAANNVATNMPMGQHPDAQQPDPPIYIKIWEGTLSRLKQGQPVFICKLEGYRRGTASETIAADWPETMHIVSLISQEHMNTRQYVGKADFLVFRTFNQHRFLGELQAKKLYAVIQLPSQTLIMFVSYKACHLIGMLFPGRPLMQQQQLQQHMHMQLQGLPLQQQQLPQMQQQPLQQQMQQMQQQQQQQPQMQHQPQMIGTGMGQQFMQGHNRVVQTITKMMQGKMVPQDVEEDAQKEEINVGTPSYAAVDKDDIAGSVNRPSKRAKRAKRDDGGVNSLVQAFERACQTLAAAIKDAAAKKVVPPGLYEAVDSVPSFEHYINSRLSRNLELFCVEFVCKWS